MNRGKKQVCVIGLGHFGWELAVALAEHCEVLAIDRDQERVDEIAEKVQRALALDVRDEATLASAIPEDLDEAVVSMGESLESSILCTLYLKRLKVPVVRVKALSDDHAAVLQQLGADEIIFPERETARRVAAHILNPNLLDFVPLVGDYKVMEVKLPQGLEDRTLADIGFRSRFGVLVIAVQKATGSLDMLPGPDYRLSKGDVLTVVGREADLLKVQQAAVVSE